MSRFLAIDFETADYQSDSACSIGLVRVENGVIVSESSHLIRPPRSNMVFTYIHGLRWEDVADAPTFAELWPQIAPLFADIDFVVAHNVGFDRKVLVTCCEVAGIVLPELVFKCTVQVARHKLGIKPAKLSNVCQVLNIDLKHHEALSDARACARIMMHGLAQTQALAQV